VSTTKAAAYDYTGYVGEDWVTLIGPISGYTLDVAGTYNWSFPNPTSGAVLGCSGTIYIPNAGSKPSNGYITDPISAWDDLKNEISIGATSGVADGGAALTILRLYAEDSAYTSTSADSYNNFVNGSYARISNSLNAGSAPIDIAPNKRIYLGIYAVNANGSYRYTTADGAPSIVTVPGPAATTITNIGPNSAKINCVTTADSNVYTKTIYYSLDEGSTWTSIGTVSTGTATTKTATLSGLERGKRYTVRTKVTTTAGSTEGTDVVFFTTDSTADLYGSVSSQTKAVDQFYGSVSSKTKKVHKIYGSVGGVAKTIFIRHV
jgi:hypothetical protein